MKKYMALLLVLLLAVGLTACGITDDDDGGTKKTTAATQTSTSSADATTTTTASAPTTVIYGTASDGSTVTTVVVLPTTETPSSTTAPVVTAPSVGGSTVTTAPSFSQTTGGSQPTVTTAPTGTTTATKAPTTATKPTSTTTTTRPAEPSVVLPAIGSDIDVTKKKDRIRVSAATAAFHADGTIAVSLTFKNYSANWITEETDYVEYTCYDKDGNVVQKATSIMIGCIDTKKNPEKTFQFNVPATTAEVRITRSQITYWTEWA